MKISQPVITPVVRSGVVVMAKGNKIAQGIICFVIIYMVNMEVWMNHDKCTATIFFQAYLAYCSVISKNALF